MAAPAPPQQAPQGQASSAQGQGDPRNLHDLAVDITTDLQKLATGLAHAGANPQAVQQLTRMAEVTGDIVKVLNQGPGVEQAAQQGPPQAGPGPGGPPQGAPQPPQPHQPTLQAASEGLHAMMQAAAQQRMAQQAQQGR